MILKDGTSSSSFNFGRIGFATVSGTSDGFINKHTVDFSQSASLRFFSGTTYDIKVRLGSIDLTAIFGTAIADYIYSLEQATAGAGVAYFKRYFNKQYYPYCVPTMLTAKPTAFKTVGFNQWDEIGEDGTIAYANGDSSPAENRIRSKNYIPCLPNMSYCFASNKNSNYIIYCYDANKAYLGYRDPRTPTSDGSGMYTDVFTTLNNAYYMRFVIQQSGWDGRIVCIHIEWDDSRDGDYEPYESHTYTLDSDITLHGIIKKDADNNLYADGDTYESDGTVNRRYGIVDLGTLSWTAIQVTQGILFRGDLSGIKKTTGSGIVPNIVCSKYITTAQSYRTDKTVSQPTESYNVDVIDSAYSDAATFKTAMSGVYLVYELATPTTEEADPYTTPQICDNWGTEEFVQTEQSGVAVICGHTTKYPIDVLAKVEASADNPVGDGLYLLKMDGGEASFVQYVPPITTASGEDGTYSLKATISGSTVTYSWVAD